MPKRAREDAVRRLVADPLKTVPKKFAETVQRGGFTVLDLVVVLSELRRLFNVDFHFTGPAEGSIELVNCPTSSWLTDRVKKTTPYAGLRTELRFSLSDMSSSDKRLWFVQDILYWPTLHVGDSDEAATDAIVKARFYGCTARHTAEEERRQLLKQPMPLSLRESFPHYTWPRWIFGAFEGLVMQRLNKATSLPTK